MREQPGDLGGLVETRWKRFGHDRVYLEAADGTKVGHIDLVKDELILDEPKYETAAQDAFVRWREIAGSTVVDADPSPAPEPIAETEATAAEPAVATRPSIRPKAPELPMLIKAKYDSSCTACGRVVKKGADLFWIPNTSVVVCPSCTAVDVQAGLDTGTAGSAATRKANAGSRKHAERLLKAYPMLGEYLNANAHKPAHVRSWIRGADGERIVGRKLDIAAQKGRLIVLHDRLLPSGGNIDHIVIGTRRICVVDAKHYRNAKITKRNDKLCINGEEEEQLIDGVRMQKFAVQDALSDRPLIADNVSAILAFVGAKFNISGSIIHRGVWCSDVKEAISYAAHRGPIFGGDTIRLTDEERLEIAQILADKFPAN
ncbi:MAG: nuclease-related domain-containing protein [Ilumatobacter fluminis]|uniref:nuclease-related domain-containing protein n=1 Tax=Ilumatobacter fluminis TaxID=467091 RepID=UPI0032EF3A49